MKPLRSTGVFLICCSAICLIVAVERYQSAVVTGRKIADQLEGIEFESVGIPLVSTVMGFVAIVFLVAGIRLLLESRKSKIQTEPLLQVPNKP
jgi:uncharacterized membrane protein